MIGFDNHSTNASVFRADSETEAYENAIQDICEDIVSNPESLCELLGDMYETEYDEVFKLLAEVMKSTPSELGLARWKLRVHLEKSARNMAIQRLYEE